MLPVNNFTWHLLSLRIVGNTTWVNAWDVLSSSSVASCVGLCSRFCPSHLHYSSQIHSCVLLCSVTAAGCCRAPCSVTAAGAPWPHASCCKRLLSAPWLLPGLPERNATFVCNSNLLTAKRMFLLAVPCSGCSSVLIKYVWCSCISAVLYICHNFSCMWNGLGFLNKHWQLIVVNADSPTT